MVCSFGNRMPDPIMDRALAQLININKVQGFVTKKQFTYIISNAQLIGSRREILMKLLDDNNVVVTNGAVRNQSISDVFALAKEVSLGDIKEDNTCLTKKELEEYFRAYYDSRLAEDEQESIKIRLASKVSHIQVCYKCLSWLRFGKQLNDKLGTMYNPVPFEMFTQQFNDAFDTIDEIESYPKPRTVK